MFVCFCPNQNLLFQAYELYITVLKDMVKGHKVNAHQVQGQIDCNTATFYWLINIK